jgi:hypothetical protein
MIPLDSLPQSWTICNYLCNDISHFNHTVNYICFSNPSFTNTGLDLWHNYIPLISHTSYQIKKKTKLEMLMLLLVELAGLVEELILD